MIERDLDAPRDVTLHTSFAQLFFVGFVGTLGALAALAIAWLLMMFTFARFARGALEPFMR
jgi:hypothetical protein